MKTNINFFELRKLFIRVKNVLLVAHPNPDLDCLCAMKVIQFLLNRYFAKKPVLYSKDPIPSQYSDLFCDVVNSVDVQNFDCIIAVEVGSFNRFKEVVGNTDSKIIINIDHHFSNDLFGNYYYVDVDSSSVNEVLYDIIKQTGIPIDSDIAYYLVMGVISDTGVLSYNNLTSKTLCMLSELRNYVDWNSIIRKIRSRSFEYYKMLSTIYRNLDRYDEIVYSYLSFDDLQELEKLGFKRGDLNNVIENISFVSQGETFFVIFEVEPSFCRVSMRSRSIDVESIARKFGGGGHKKAAGFKINYDYKSLIQVLINEIKSQGKVLQEKHYLEAKNGDSTC
ncbi:MAG: DHH family phosphoesterase [bacterium]